MVLLILGLTLGFAWAADLLKTEGTVLDVSVAPSTTPEGTTNVYWATVKFYDGGRAYTFKTTLLNKSPILGLSSDKPRFKKDDKIQVVYNPANPTEAGIALEPSIFRGFYFWIGLCALLVAYQIRRGNWSG